MVPNCLLDSYVVIKLPGFDINSLECYISIINKQI